MPTYEMPLLIRIMSNPELKSVLKRTANHIFEIGGFLRKIDHLGKLKTPYKIMGHNGTNKEAHYFVIHFEAPFKGSVEIAKEYSRDVDLLRYKIYNKNIYPPIECTFEEENLPPPYRPSVIEMIKIGEQERSRKEKKKFKFNTGLDYDPFQR